MENEFKQNLVEMKKIMSGLYMAENRPNNHKPKALLNQNWDAQFQLFFITHLIKNIIEINVSHKSAGSLTLSR